MVLSLKEWLISFLFTGVLIVLVLRAGYDVLPGSLYEVFAISFLVICLINIVAVSVLVYYHDSIWGEKHKTS